MYESQILAQAHHDLIRPWTARLPEISHSFLATDRREEAPHRVGIFWRLTKACGTLEENGCRPQNARGGERRAPGIDDGLVDPKAASLRLGPLVERPAQTAIGAARPEVSDHLPRFHRELERRWRAVAPPLQRRRRRWIVEPLLHLDDRVLLDVGRGADGESTEPEFEIAQCRVGQGHEPRARLGRGSSYCRP